MSPGDLNRMFDALAPSPEQRQEGLHRLLQEERNARPMKRMKQMKRLAVAGIAAALMLVLCAAAVVTHIDEKLLGYFHMTPDQEPLMAPTAVRVEQSHTYDGGWTVAVRQVLSDRWSLVARIDVTAPDGTRVDSESSWLGISADETPHRMGSAVSVYPLSGQEEEDAEDNQATFLFHISFEDDDASGIPGNSFEITPEAFEYTTSNGTRQQIALNGWTCPVTVSAQDPGILYELNQPVTLQDGSLTLESVYLSPISVVLRLRNGASNIEDADQLGPDDLYVASEVRLETASGMAVLMDPNNEFGGTSNPDPEDPDSIYATLQYRTAEIMDPAEISTLTFCGQNFVLH